MWEWWPKYTDEAISFLSLDKTTSYYLINDKFPEDEAKFKEFFLIHPPTRKQPQVVTVGCIIRSTKTITEMKKTTDAKTSILSWLKENKVFIATNTIGHHVTRMISNLIHIHPRVMHQDSLHNTISNVLQAVKITADEAKAMAPDASDHYRLAMDSGDNTQAFVPPFEVSLPELVPDSRTTGSTPRQ